MKEETKCYCGHTTYCDCGPKQEILEETAEQFINKLDFNSLEIDDKIFDAIMFGAKWQQEQILDFLYSEVTERRDYSASKMCEKVIEFIEQFKKK